MRHPLFFAYLALASVCFFWGTTYVGIRVALESLPPPVLVATRFLISGVLVLVGALLLGARMPAWREIPVSVLTGVVVLGVGNGCLAYAQLFVPSGLASLMVTLSPFWMVGIEALMPGGERLNGPILGSLGVGMAGAMLLVAPGFSGDVASRSLLWGFLILQLGCLSWTWGSLFQKRQPSVAHPIVVGGVQQLAAGLAWTPLALMAPGEARWDSQGIAAIAYLAVFGSIVGYSSYVYALQHLPVSLVSVYTYVNPVVAVALGWLFYREPFGWREGVAMATIFLGVALVKAASRRVGGVVKAGGPPHPVEPEDGIERR